MIKEDKNSLPDEDKMTGMMEKTKDLDKIMIGLGDKIKECRDIKRNSLK